MPSARLQCPFYWIDAFTSRVFGGNPAGVCPLTAWPEDELLQQIARQNGLAETAYFVRTGEARYRLRWFTPAVEVDLCGHATLAAAHVLFHELNLTADHLTFDTRSGPLQVARLPDQRLEMDFPARPPAPVVATDRSARLAAALGGVPPIWIGKARDYLCVLVDPSAVEQLQPDLAALATFDDTLGFIVTARGTDCDFVSRFFAPRAGVPEDPVTGSAHCTLVPYWAGQLGRVDLHARQVSARGGELWCRLKGDRVHLAGQAVTYLRGDLSA